MASNVRYAIFGGSRGIGFAVANRAALSSESGSVALIAQSAVNVDRAVSKIGRNCQGFVCDIRDSTQVNHLFKVRLICCSYYQNQYCLGIKECNSSC